MELFEVQRLADKLRSDFKSVADLLGPEKAFMVFATPIVNAGYDPEKEEAFVRLIRVTYDDYVDRTST